MNKDLNFTQLRYDPLSNLRRVSKLFKEGVDIYYSERKGKYYKVVSYHQLVTLFSKHRYFYTIKEYTFDVIFTYQGIERSEDVYYELYHKEGSDEMLNVDLPYKEMSWIDNYPIKIDEVVEMLQRLKDAGSDYVSMGYLTDQREYIFHGFKRETKK